MAMKAKKWPTAETTGELGDAAEKAVFAGCEELAALARENFIGVLRANAVLTQGMEALGKELMAYARDSLESAAEVATASLAAKTLDDLAQLNSDFAKAAFERMVQGSTKLSEMGVKAANEALAPLGDLVEATVRRLGKPLAA